MQTYQKMLEETIKVEDEIKEILKGVGGSDDVKKLCAIAERIGACRLSCHPNPTRFNEPAQYVNEILPNLYDKLNIRYSLISTAGILEQAKKTHNAARWTFFTAIATFLIAIASFISIIVVLQK